MASELLHNKSICKLQNCQNSFCFQSTNNNSSRSIYGNNNSCTVVNTQSICSLSSEKYKNLAWYHKKIYSKNTNRKSSTKSSTTIQPNDNKCLQTDDKSMECKKIKSNTTASTNWFQKYRCKIHNNNPSTTSYNNKKILCESSKVFKNNFGYSCCHHHTNCHCCKNVCITANVVNNKDGQHEQFYNNKNECLMGDNLNVKISFSQQQQPQEKPQQQCQSARSFRRTKNVDDDNKQQEKENEKKCGLSSNSIDYYTDNNLSCCCKVKHKLSNEINQWCQLHKCNCCCSQKSLYNVTANVAANDSTNNNNAVVTKCQYYHQNNNNVDGMAYIYYKCVNEINCNTTNNNNTNSQLCKLYSYNKWNNVQRLQTYCAQTISEFNRNCFKINFLSLFNDIQTFLRTFLPILLLFNMLPLLYAGKN